MGFTELIQSYDIYMLDVIHKIFVNGGTNAFWKIVTLFGDDGIFWIALGLLLVVFRRTRKDGTAMLIAIVTGFIVGNMVLKNAVGRIRPYDVNLLVPVVVEHLSDYSFPSGHTMASLGAALALFYREKKAGIPAVVLAVLIMVSRLHLYVHYPSDVLGGLIVGTIAGVIATLISEHVIPKRFFTADFIRKRKKGAHEQTATE